MDKVIDIHVLLPEPLVARLDQAAAELEVRRTELLRKAVVELLDRLNAERIEREMADYVEELSPYSGEFVSESQKHVVKRLLREARW